MPPFKKTLLHIITTYDQEKLPVLPSLVPIFVLQLNLLIQISSDLSLSLSFVRANSCARKNSKMCFRN